MEVTLKRNGLTAVTESFGGELVSLRDEGGMEYIWSGEKEDINITAETMHIKQNTKSVINMFSNLKIN